DTVGPPCPALARSLCQFAIAHQTASSLLRFSYISWMDPTADWKHSALRGERGVGKVYRHLGNRSNQWRKHTGARRYRWRSLAGVPMRLVFLTLCASGALCAD